MTPLPIVCSKCRPTCGRHAVSCEGYLRLDWGQHAGQQVEPSKKNGERKQ